MTTGAVVAALGAFSALLVLKGRGTLHEMLYPRLYRRSDFPENHFPADDPAGFRAKTARGYEKMSRASLVVCGITKDDAETLPLTIRRIEKTGALFRSYRVVIFENDSVDGTLGMLRAWEASNPNVTVLSESLCGHPDFPGDRFARLALCRNRYVDHLDASPELADCDYVLVVDLDLTGGWSLDGIASSFAETGWDAMASNSIGYHSLRRTYYDTLALRPQTILEPRWFYRIIGEAWKLRRGAPPIPVLSAFGGLCLYRRDALRSRRYAGTYEGVEACEHLALHGDGDMRFFLNPSQITVVGTQEDKGYGEPRHWRGRLRRIFLNW